MLLLTRTNKFVSPHFVPKFLQQQKKKQDEELLALRKEMTALHIMKNNYDQIVKANQSRLGQSEHRVPDEIKFHLVSPTINSIQFPRSLQF